MKTKKKKQIFLGPVIMLLILIAVVIITSAIFAALEVKGTKTEISNNTLESSIIAVNSLMTGQGFKYMLSSALENLQLFKPLFLLLVSLIAIGISEASGLFKALFKPFRNVNPKIITFITLFIGIISSFFGEYSYVVFIPYAGMIYKYLGRRPMLGIITMFLGITMGYGTGVIPSIDDYVLGQYTTLAATIDVDPNYVYNLNSNIYIMLFSTLILTIVGTFIIEATLSLKIPKAKIEESDLKTPRKPLLLVYILFITISLIIAYMIIPDLPNSGLLLGDGDEYVYRLFGDGAPFKEGFVYILLVINMICGCAYGYLSGNIKNSNEYSIGLSKEFEGLGYVFVLLFFTAQLTAMLKWTNLGDVIVVNFVSFLGQVQFSGIALVITTFVLIILMGILAPSLVTKYVLCSPILVPLFMKSNITPDFTQFLFRVADGVGKCFTPIFPYFIIMLAFLEKYNYDEDYKITIFGTLKLIMPSALLFAGLWLLILVSWYIVGLPLGIGGAVTL